MRKLLFLVALFCLLSAAAPLFFGVRNLGVVVLFCASLFFWGLCFGGDFLSRHPILRGFAVFLTAFGICAVGVLSFFMLRQAYFRSPPQDEEIAVIVLGGHVIGNQPSLMLKNRLDTAAEYLESNPRALCVVTGGQGHDEDYPEAQVMAEYLAARGIDRDRILEESASTNTRENIRFAKEYLPKEHPPVVVVTDGFHQLRASIYARGEGLGQAYALSSTTPWGLIPCYWVRDLMGVVLAWLEYR